MNNNYFKIILIVLAAVLLSAVYSTPPKLTSHAYDVAERFSTLETLEAGDVVVLSETKIDEKIASEALKVDEKEVRDAMKEMNIDEASKLAEAGENNNLNDAPGDKQTESSNAITGKVTDGIPNTSNEKASGKNNNIENKISIESSKQKIINKLNEKDGEIKTSTGKDKLIAAKAALVKTTAVQNDINIIGVVSSNPAFIMGYGSELKDTNSVPIALIGRVPAKVSLENGQISVGDPLTSSAKKGYAAKSVNSGRIIGYAMENYNEKSNSEKILVFVQPGWHNANEASSQQLNYLNKVNGSVIIKLG